MKRFSQNNLKKAVSAAVWIAVWHFAAQMMGEGILLPSPFAVVQRFFELAGNAAFLQAALRSALAIAAGLGTAVAAAVILAVLSDLSSWVRALVFPAVVLCRTVPVASFIILLLWWVSSSGISAPIAAIMAFPVIYSALLSTLTQVDPNLLEAAHALGMSRFVTMRKIKLPLSAAAFANGVITASGLAIKAGIAAEVIGQAQNTLGGRLYLAKIYLETESLFAVTLAVLLLGTVAERLVRLTLRLIFKQQLQSAI